MTQIDGCIIPVGPGVGDWCIHANSRVDLFRKRAVEHSPGPPALSTHVMSHLHMLHGQQCCLLLLSSQRTAELIAAPQQRVLVRHEAAAVTLLGKYRQEQTWLHAQAAGQRVNADERAGAVCFARRQATKCCRHAHLLHGSAQTYRSLHAQEIVVQGMNEWQEKHHRPTCIAFKYTL